VFIIFEQTDAQMNRLFTLLCILLAPLMADAQNHQKTSFQVPLKATLTLEQNITDPVVH
jgi:hypothetical protein